MPGSFEQVMEDILFHAVGETGCYDIRQEFLLVLSKRSS
jgi:hypothetical protein